MEDSTLATWMDKDDNSEIYNSEHEVDSKNFDNISKEHIIDSSP